MAHFDTTFDHQRTLAVRAWIAGNHVTDICYFWRRGVAIPVDAEVVLTVDVRASREIAHGGNGTVNHDRNRQINRAQ
ncbi:hypothetical protein D3C85_1682400 [compost metagenome]